MRAACSFMLFLAVSSGAAFAGEDCKCRGPNVEASEGQTVCITTSNGSQMARCERVLNNTSWKFLGTPCPPGNISQLPSKPAPKS